MRYPLHQIPAAPDCREHPNGSCTDFPGFSETEYGIVKRINAIREWLDQVAQRTGKARLRLLDYGCGTGDYVTFPLACDGHTVVGVDIHEPSVVEAARRYALPNLSFRVADLDELVQEKLTFDVIVCSEVLEHMHDPVSFLIKLRQLLRPGGRLIITTPNGYGSYEMLHRAQRLLQRSGLHALIRWLFWTVRSSIRWLRGQSIPSRPLEMMPSVQDPGFLNHHSGHVQFFRLRTLERILDRSGFQVAARRTRTLLCGPYVDVLFHVCPCRQMLLQANNRLADLLPFSWAADWMFLLEPREGRAR